ncbi:LuxR C-terminal-related transcriptional regulator [Cohnella zeiphila]|uniref:HTH luxR-type domain-containing protein n=1 Tax=Cohnella zeiphila TaxID=2761120 RepID=A0A7X0SSD6_9BACL|nr:LuxR C-terminal-related transcriptional regulator [Cohnella zeiphila]MBB6735252.1 hypothetical protein [Cohnella zeiphila]
MPTKQASSSLSTIPASYSARCLELLKREARRPLLAIVAPPGYGKTMLLEAWKEVLEPGCTVGWLSLEPEDNDIRRWFKRLLGAMPFLGEEWASELPEPPASLPPGLLDKLAAALRERNEEIRWIFDRYEAIREPAIHDSIAYLIERAGANVRYCIASRESLPFSDRLLRLSPGPFTVSLDHLKLNLAEIRQGVRGRTGSQLQADDWQSLHQLTDGWPLAVERFASLMDGIRAEPMNESAALAALPSEVRGVLLNNVFLRHPEELQRLMLLTSVPDFFDAELARRLTGDASCHLGLERLLQTNLFLHRSNDGRYRYHPLFAFFLRERLKEEDKSAPLTMHERISRWAQEEHLLVDAIQHALLIPDYERAAELLLGDIAATLSHSRSTLIRLMEQFPASEMSGRPSLAMFYAWLLVAVHRISASETVLDLAEAGMTEEDYAFAPTGEDLRGYIATIRSRILLLRRETERGLQLMHEAAARLNGPGYLYNHSNTLEPYGSSLLKSNVGYWGAIDQSIAIYGYAEPLWNGVNQGYGIIQTILGECYYERNRLGEAEKSLLGGRRIGLDLMDPGIIMPSSLLLIQLRCAYGEHQAAQVLLDETRKLLEKNAEEEGTAVLDACQARLQMRTGQLPLAKKWLRNQKLDPEGVLDLRCMFEYLTLLRAFVILGQPRQGIAFGERLLQFAESWYLHYYIAEIQLLLSVLYDGNGRGNTALRKLETALGIGAKEGYFQLFLDEWDTAASLFAKFERLARTRRSLSPDIQAFYGQLLELRSEQELFVDKDRFARKKLTGKEYKVLQQIVAGRSNAAIADELSIRLETVKTHCKNIYRKLGLKSRKAVQRHYGAEG